MAYSRLGICRQRFASLWSAFVSAQGWLSKADSPKGFLGVNWGEDAAVASRRLGVKGEGWEAWEGGRDFEACFEIDHMVKAFGRDAYIRLFRRQDRLEGLSLRFKHCGSCKDDLARAIRQEFALKDGEGMLYHVFHDGAAIRLSHDGSDDSCTLTIAGPKFGKAFSEYLLEEGFKNLAHGLQPH